MFKKIQKAVSKTGESKLAKNIPKKTLKKLENQKI
jgi:hypothetical protein